MGGVMVEQSGTVLGRFQAWGLTGGEPGTSLIHLP